MSSNASKVSLASGLSAPVVFTASGTWTPPATGKGIFMARLVGGGAGGAGGAATYGGAGGGGGEVVEVYFEETASAPEAETEPVAETLEEAHDQLELELDDHDVEG